MNHLVANRVLQHVPERWYLRQLHRDDIGTKGVQQERGAPLVGEEALNKARQV